MDIYSDTTYNNNQNISILFKKKTLLKRIYNISRVIRRISYSIVFTGNPHFMILEIYGIMHMAIFRCPL